MLQRFQYKNSWENKGKPHLSLIRSIFFTSKSRYCNVPIVLYIKMKVQNVKPLIYLDRNCNSALHQQHNEGCSKWMKQVLLSPSPPLPWFYSQKDQHAHNVQGFFTWKGEQKRERGYWPKCSSTSFASRTEDLRCFARVQANDVTCIKIEASRCQHSWAFFLSTSWEALFYSWTKTISYVAAAWNWITYTVNEVISNFK
jgi:hypothetical protein